MVIGFTRLLPAAEFADDLAVVELAESAAAVGRFAGGGTAALDQHQIAGLCLREPGGDRLAPVEHDLQRAARGRAGAGGGLREVLDPWLADVTRGGEDEVIAQLPC